MFSTMNAHWQQFLITCGARPGPVPGPPLSFGDGAGELAAASGSAMMCDLSHLGVIGLRGADAQGFLQGQLTCDVREAGPASSRPGALCTPKGRALATFRLWQDDAGYCMQLPAARLDAVRKRLSMYVLRAKVEISDRSDDTVRLGIAGPEGAARLGAALGLPHDALPGPGAIIQAGPVQLLGLDGGRFELVTPCADGPRLWHLLCATIRPGGEPAWRWASIMAGEAMLHEATAEQFVPQMLDLDLTGGIGFSKGCYTGQEVIARTQYLGRLKQRLWLGHLAAPEGAARPGALAPRSEQGDLPAPGTPLCSADLDGQSTGMVVESAPAPAGGIALLAVIRTDSAQAYPVHLGSLAGPVLHPLVPAHASDGAAAAGGRQG